MIKFKKIDNMIIVILDGVILNRNLPDGTAGENLFTNINNSISKLNNHTGTLFLSDEDYLLEKNRLVNLMVPPKAKTQLKLNFDEASVEEQSDIIAHKDLAAAKRIADISGEFEYDKEGRVFLKGFSIPIPESLANALLDAHYNEESKYTVDSLVNFWQWAVLNPNKKARVDLFGWFDTGEFVITDQGLIVAYRNVDIKTKGTSEALETFVNTKFVKVKKNKQSPKNYVVFKEGVSYTCKWAKDKPELLDDENSLGLLSELYADNSTSENATVYTDNWTHSMIIKMGEEVSMPREDCDEDQNASCSSGLHFKSPAFGNGFGNTTVVVLVNPYNIVAFPTYNNTKGRCCAYLPVGKAEVEDGRIVPFNSGTYEFEYSKYTSEKLSELINNSNFSDLVSQGLIAEDLTEEDFEIVKAQVKSIIDKRIIDVC